MLDIFEQLFCHKCYKLTKSKKLKTKQNVTLEAYSSITINIKYIILKNMTYFNACFLIIAF